MTAGGVNEAKEVPTVLLSSEGLHTRDLVAEGDMLPLYSPRSGTLRTGWGGAQFSRGLYSRRHKVAWPDALLGRGPTSHTKRIVVFLGLVVLLLLMMILTQGPELGSGSMWHGRRAADEADFPARGLAHLVMVAGHAVFTGHDFRDALSQDAWYLEPYQQVPGQVESFLDHMRLGVEETAGDPEALLLFSGGQTRRDAGPRSEGFSYWSVADGQGWFGQPEVRSRAFTEDHARDSFENLLFSMCRFYELTGRYPSKVTVISYEFKRDRFSNMHCNALKYPTSQFFFHGTPALDPEGAARGEAATMTAFKTDPYSCKGSLRAKKALRDPFAVGPYAANRCPDLAHLLRHCSTKPFKGHVPW